MNLGGHKHLVHNDSIQMEISYLSIDLKPSPVSSNIASVCGAVLCSPTATEGRHLPVVQDLPCPTKARVFIFCFC